MDSIYEQAKAAGVPIDHHESDLYLKCGPVADALVKSYQFASNAQRFWSNVDGALWWDIPFAYSPWWTKRDCTV